MEMYGEMIEYSKTKLQELREKMSIEFADSKYNSICVYACGSLGRYELTEKSDLDLFFINKCSDNISNRNIDKYEFFYKLLNISTEMDFEKPSKNGMYWIFTAEDDLKDIGSQREDYVNGFTARMLLILESKPLMNDEYYYDLVKSTINKYFSEYRDHRENFYPLYLMNDILRYWYTLTLNYEYRRSPQSDPRKNDWKRLKLKYARLLTCYSLLACLYKKNITPEYVVDCIILTPLERLEYLRKENASLNRIVNDIKASYEYYLNLRKEENSIEDDIIRREAFEKADEFHTLVVKELMKKVSDLNPELKNKMDVY